MALSRSSEPVPPAVTPGDGEVLLDLADASISSGLAGRPVPPLEIRSLSESLREPGGAFVSIHVDGRLNGCIGSLGSSGPLAREVQWLARSAAFSDPRLPALRPGEFDRATIEVSVLSPLEPVSAGSRSELFDRIRPGVDGLVLNTRGRHSLFLPAVWDQLPDPDDFLDHLQRKAGLVPKPWRPDMSFERFAARVFTRDRAGRPPVPNRSDQIRNVGAPGSSCTPSELRAIETRLY